jgi:hypothetical protein
MYCRCIVWAGEKISQIHVPERSVYSNEPLRKFVLLTTEHGNVVVSAYMIFDTPKGVGRCIHLVRNAAYNKLAS